MKIHLDTDFGGDIDRTCTVLTDDAINFLNDPLDADYLRAAIAADGKPTRVVTEVDRARFSDWWCAAWTRRGNEPS